MIVIVTYGLFGFYMILRTYLSYLYNIDKKKHSNLYYERQSELSNMDPQAILKNNQIDINQMNRDFDEMSVSKQVTVEENKCKKLYQIDLSLKRIGSIVLSILSMLGLWINFKGEFLLNSLFLAMLPSLVNLFNSIFEWFEIKLDDGFMNPFPKKY